jgi:integrase
VEKVKRSIGAVRLVDLRPAHLERLRDDLGTHLAPQTVADALRVLSQAFAKAEAKGLIGRNPAAASLVQRPSGPTRDFPIITPARGRQILAACEGADPWDAAAHLALGLSLRREEALALRWDDVDLAAATVTVERTLTYAGGDLHWGPPKSDAGRRVLTAPDFVVMALRRHRKAQSERRMLLGPAWLTDDRAGDLVIDRGMGEPWLPATSRPTGRGSPRPRGSVMCPSMACGTVLRRCSWPQGCQTRSWSRSWGTRIRESSAATRRSCLS